MHEAKTEQPPALEKASNGVGQLCMGQPTYI